MPDLKTTVVATNHNNVLNKIYADRKVENKD